MVIRLLAFDPDPRGRRLIQEGCASLGDGCRLCLRTTASACARELRSGRYDGLLLGMPIASTDLFALMLSCQTLECPPTILLVGETSLAEDLRNGRASFLQVDKSRAGLRRLVQALPGHVRARSLSQIGESLNRASLGLRSQDAEAELARALVKKLGRVGIRSLFSTYEPQTKTWRVYASGYSPGAIQEVHTALRDSGREPPEADGAGPSLPAPLVAGQSRYSNHPLELLRLHPALGYKGASRTRRALALRWLYLLPILMEPDLRAILLVGDRLTEIEREALDGLAGPLRVALTRAASLHQIRQQSATLRALQQVSLIINATLDTEDLLDKVLELLATVIPFDSACVIMGGEGGLTVRAARGYDRFTKTPATGRVLRPADFPSLERLITSGQPQLVSSAEGDPQWVAPGIWRHVRSWLGIPIQRREETIALLSLDSATPAFFQDSHVEIATAFARQMAVALDNADLFWRERQASRRNRLLQELAGVVNSTTDMQGILGHLVRYATQALEVRRAAVMLLTPEGQHIVDLMVLDPGGAFERAVRSHWGSKPIPLEAFDGVRRRFKLNRARVLRRFGLSSLGSLADEADIQSVLIAPIRREGSLLGVLAVDEPGVSRDFGEDDKALAQALADHAAVAIHNARAFSELRRHSEELTSLFNLGIALSQELTPEGVTDLLFDQVDRLLNVDSAVMARLQTPDTLFCDVLDSGKRLPALTVPVRGPTLSGYVVQQGEPLLINDYDAEAGRLPVPGLTAGIPTASWLGVPLIARGETIGAVSVQSEAPHRFGQEHLRLLRMIANQIAAALDNVRLLQSTAHRAEELRLVNEIGRYAVSVLDIQQLVREVAVRILHAFHYYSVQMMLDDGGLLIPQAVAIAPEGRLVDVRATLRLSESTIMTTVANTGHPWLVPDVSREPCYRPLPELPLTQSELAVPLTIAGEVVGVLDVQSDKVGGLSEADLELSQVLAAQIAISFANARLFAEVRAHAAQLEERVTIRTTEIRSQKERTEAILRSVADAVLVLDLNGRLVLANPVAQRLLEGPRAGDLVAHIGRLHAQGGVVSEQLELGAMTLQALASPVTQEDLAIGTVIVLRDITRLRELDRLKSQFVATVSHELRTPLANIKLYLSLLRKGREDRRDQYQQVLERETGRLSDMIEDLLDLSRLEGRPQVIEREPVEVVPLLEQVVENLRPSFVAKGLRLGLEGSHRVIVPINRNQVVRVLTNLLSNALQYTAPGGWVRVKLEPEEQINGRAMMRVDVQDNGQGIAEEDLPYIFERFYRGQQARDSQVPGSGLGLAIVHDIVERHGGRVEAVSQLGEGSTFTVWLPLDQGG